MRSKWLAAGLTVCLCLALAPIVAQQPQAAKETPATAAPKAAPPVAKKAMELGDILAWKSMGVAVISNDGAWVAYRLSPIEGDSDVVVRSIATDKEYRFPIGEAAGGAQAGPPGLVMASPSIQFSDDGKWVGLTVYPTRADAAKLKKQKKTPHNKLQILDLTTGKDTTIENVKRFAFSGERSGWLAIQKDPADTPGSGAAAGPGPGAAGGSGGSAPDRAKGTDVLLRELVTGRDLNIGNVSEFAFNKAGTFLALVIDAADKAGNGLQLRNMETGAVRVLDSDKAVYEKLAWTTEGDGLAVLETIEDKDYKDKLCSVLGYTGFGTQGGPTGVVFDPKREKTFPADMSVSPDRTPGWTEDLSMLTFGIRAVHKKPADDKPAGSPPGAGTPPNGDKPDDVSADEKPDLVIWHHKDPRLQSQQQVEEDSDKKFSYLCVYRVADKAFVRLADDQVRDVSLPRTGTWAVGLDESPYEFTGSTEGRNYQDVYAIDMKTGTRKLAVKQARWYFGQSPVGGRFLYYDNGHFFTYNMAAGTPVNITVGAPVSFVDMDDDHNVVKPPVRPVGWDKTGTAVLLSDGWDVWKIPATGGAAVNLTVNGRKDAVRYQTRVRLDPEEKGIDLDVPQFFLTYGEWTKKTGIARVDGSKPAVESLLWADASVGRTVLKAKNADAVVYSRETFSEAPELYASNLAFKQGARLSDVGAQQKAFLWSSGAMLVNYTSAKGAKLQGALYLPANYEKGKSYPTIVYIYEKLSDGLNRFTAPTANGFNASVYTSNGYAVLMPDITYTINDPGMSAVWCVLPALKAAIATGVVDGAHVGLQGHSWGGYQTAFLVTQTKAFAAAIAGAPLTNMISMYSLIYKNSGSGNMAIFESSQGRFRGGYWDNWEAYVRNSPVFSAKNVTTPLILLHNDKDGAVDFTQGVEYYNTLRRLGKNVVMLEYVGENHGLAKQPNRQDYTIRMKEFFDHWLMGKPAPAWYTEGVPRLKMDEHLKERAGMGKPKDKAADKAKL
jgi:dipeptidyl aminopeptidase/acylaminoacyl peptidase